MAKTNGIKGLKELTSFDYDYKGASAYMGLDSIGQDLDSQCGLTQEQNQEFERMYGKDLADW